MRTRKVTFDPGSLESMTLSLWRRHGGRMYMAKLQGTYTIFCGAGWTHDVAIDVHDSGWDVERGHYDHAGLIIDAYNGDRDAAAELAHSLIGYELEDWFDPCDVPEDEEDA